MNHHSGDTADDQSRSVIDCLFDLAWLEEKNRTGQILGVPKVVREALATLPSDDPRYVLVRLINEALQHEVRFIHRHREDYPQGLFQCLWNHGWWYDCPEAPAHYREDYDAPRRSGPKLYRLLEQWRAEKELRQPGFVWLRALRPSPIHIGSPLLMVLSGQAEAVVGLGFSPDGRQLASASTDRRVCVWDLESGEKIHAFRLPAGSGESLLGMAFSRDMRRLATAHVGHMARSWSMPTGETSAEFLGHANSVCDVDFSEDGQFIASSSHDHSVRVWNADTGAEARILRPFIPAENQAAMAAVSARDVSALYEWCRASVTCVAFSSDGTRIAGGSGGGTLHVWDVASGAELWSRTAHDSAVTCVTFSRDGRSVATGSNDNTARLWDVATGERLRVISGHMDCINGVAFFPDGQRLATASTDGTVRIWNVQSGARLVALRTYEEPVTSVSISPDGRRLVSGHQDGTIRLWDVSTDNELRLLRGHDFGMVCFDISKDGNRIASGDDAVRVWDTATGLELNVMPKTDDAIESIGYSYDGRRIVCRYEYDRFAVWDATSFNLAELELGDEEACWLHNGLPGSAWRFGFEGQEIEVLSSGDLAVIARTPCWHAQSCGPQMSGAILADCVDYQLAIYKLEGKPQ